jgi:two-component system cell cycle sensor histidine kinase/response regulator CckA
VDRDGRVRCANRALAELLRQPPSEIVGRPYLELVRCALGPVEPPSAARVQEVGCTAVAELSAGGRWFRVTASPVRDTRGAVTATAHVWADITASRQAEAERPRLLRERDELADQLGLLLESTAEGVYGVDAEGRCTFLNRAAAKALGYAPGELIHQSVHRLLHHSRADGKPNLEAHCAFCRPPANGQDGRRKGEVLWRQDGTSFPVEYSCYPILREGTPAGVVVSFVDITDRERLEEQFRQAQKMEAVGRLAGGIAHDFNNLLTVINGYSEILLAGSSPGGPTAEIVEEIRRAGERAASLTRQLLIFSRRQVVIPKVLDLNVAVTEMEKLLRRLIGEDIECVVQAGAQLGRVKMDRGQVEQVVMNLVVNARDAMPKGGKITVRTADVDLDEVYAAARLDVRPGHYVELSVSDTGCGMTPDILNHLFEPFFTTKEAGKGTGLGLPTVYGIVKQNGGHIDVDSTPGVGTTFRIYLPRAADSSTPSDRDKPAARPLRGSATVLVAEDEELVRNLIRMVLQWNGYTVLESRHGQEALAIFKQHAGPIDLLITDVVMPHMNGRELAEQLLQLKPDLKVLYISGYTGGALGRLDVLEEGSDFLQKPFTPDLLAQKIGDMLDQS